jgi:hypothetical protein
MFSKSRINEPGPKAEAEKPKAPESPMTKPAMDFTPSAPKGKAAASVLSSDLTVVGNLRTTGDIQVEGTVEGDIRAHLLTVGESATIRGEIVADDIVVNGRVIGRVRGPEGPPDLDRAGRGRHHPQDHRHRIGCAFRRLGAASGRPAGHRPPGRDGARWTPRLPQRRRISRPTMTMSRASEGTPVPVSFCADGDRRIILWAAILASSMGFIDSSVTSIAMPAMREALGASLSQAQWINAAYLCRCRRWCWSAGRWATASASRGSSRWAS